MKRLDAVLRWALLMTIIISLVVSLVMEVRNTKPLEYFSHNPWHLLYVASAACAGGVLFVSWYRLTRKWQTRLAIFGWAAMAAHFALVFGLIADLVFSWPDLQTDGRPVASFCFMGLCVVIIMATAVARIAALLRSGKEDVPPEGTASSKQ